MDIRIMGTDNTRALVQNIIGGLRKEKPTQRHINYAISLLDKNHRSEFLTHEQDGVLRNVSMLRINNSSPFITNILAVIWNKSGDIAIHEMPFFMSKKTAFLKIQEFLAQLQFNNITKPQEVSCKTGHSKDLNSLNTIAKFDKFNIEQNIHGSNNMWSFECVEEYKHESLNFK